MPLVNGTGNSPSPGRPIPGVVKQDESSGGSVDTTKTRSGPQRIRMSGGERPIGAAKDKQHDTDQIPRPCANPHPPCHWFSGRNTYCCSDKDEGWCSRKGWGKERGCAHPLQPRCATPNPGLSRLPSCALPATFGTVAFGGFFFWWSMKTKFCL